jgi:hypothetical protein
MNEFTYKGFVFVRSQAIDCQYDAINTESGCWIIAWRHKQDVWFVRVDVPGQDIHVERRASTYSEALDSAFAASRYLWRLKQVEQ